MAALQTCTDEERQEETALALELIQRTIIDNPYIPVEPSEPQGVFLTLPASEILYGGAGGGGKTFGLLMAALQYVDVPNYSAILLRRTFTDLEQAEGLIPLSHQWLRGTDAEWDGQQHQWKFPKSNATLAFGYMESDNDRFRYKGAPFQFIGWDELTSFSEIQYRFMFSRRRKLVNQDVPLRTRAASNPGDRGHEWVKKRFIDVGTYDRVYIPARMDDNPFLDVASYRDSLKDLDAVTRAQMEHGDWTVRPNGNMFKHQWFDGMILEDAPPVVRTVRYWDLAATEDDGHNDPDYTAGVKMGLDRHGFFPVMDSIELRATPADVESEIKSTAQDDGREVEIYIEQEPGASGKSMIDHYRRTVLPGYVVHGVRSTGDKITRAKPFSAACQNGLVRLVRGSWVGRFIDRLVGFGMKGVHDDTGDAAAGAHRALTGGIEDWSTEDFASILSSSGGNDTEEDDIESRILNAAKGGFNR